MPVRFQFRPIQLNPGTLLQHLWAGRSYYRPSIDIYVVGPTGAYERAVAELDTGCDWVVFDDGVAANLGLRRPFSRVVPVSGVAGPVQDHFTMPPDGTVSLFLTDYRAWCYLPAPPVGFWPATGPGQPPRRNVLGFTGFLQHFGVLSRNYLSRPEIELVEAPAFPGSFGPFSAQVPLTDQVRSLQLSSRAP